MNCQSAGQIPIESMERPENTTCAQFAQASARKPQPAAQHRRDGGLSGGYTGSARRHVSRTAASRISGSVSILLAMPATRSRLSGS